MKSSEEDGRQVDASPDKATREAVAPDERPGATHHTTNIHGPNYGGIQQGGQNNRQSISVNIYSEFEAGIDELLTLVENSSLAPLEKFKAVSDINAVRALSRMESSPEVVEEARQRIDGFQSVISLSADLVSLGMPVIQIMRAFFGA